MKFVCAILLCCLAVASAGRSSAEDDLIDNNLDDCRKELNIPDPAKPQDAAAVHGKEGSADCLMFCMQKKFGMFNEDGSLNRALILATVEPEKKEGVKILMDYCERKVKPLNGCKMAACFVPVEQRINI